MEISANDIADAVLKTFDGLEQKRKPLNRSNGLKEWVPLSGIIMQSEDGLQCVALATGMKCLPQNKISQAQGVVLHDWHAEVLAIRAFNRFLLEECHALALDKTQSSRYIRFRRPDERTDSHFQPFALHDGIKIHMYCSEAPCGDASMELTMAAQEDATPWTLPTSSSASTILSSKTSSPPGTSSLSPPAASTPSTPQPLLHGRSYFSSLGLVRRKPSRPDAPPTLSKSCSDKLSLHQCTSLLSSLTSHLISPSSLYLTSVILPESQNNATATHRAFNPEGRMAPVASKVESNPELEPESGSNPWLSAGYRFQPFQIHSTDREFAYSRRQELDSSGTAEKLVPSNNSAVWTPRFSETLMGGTLQGKSQFSLKGASKVCKRRCWRLAIEVARAVEGAAAGAGTAASEGKRMGLERALRQETYGEVKGGDVLAGRRMVKRDVRDGLGGWIRNEGGEGFAVEGVDV